MTPPSILLFGNCQAEYLALIGGCLPSLRGVVTFKVIPIQLVTAEDWTGRFDHSFTADVAVLWDQVETGEPKEHRRQMHARVRPDWQVVKFPPFTMLALWPFAGNDPRLSLDCPYRYPWSDSVAAMVSRELPLSDDAAYDRYMRLSMERMPDLDRRLRMDAGRWHASDQIADIKAADWVLENFRSTQVFYTAGHLAPPPYRWMMKQLLQRTGILSPQQIWQAGLEVDLLLRHHRGQDVEVAPVHPAVAAHFGLTWYDPDTRYRWRSHEWNFREYILKYIRWAPFLD